MKRYLEQHQEAVDDLGDAVQAVESALIRLEEREDNNVVVSRIPSPEAGGHMAGKSVQNKEQPVSTTKGRESTKHRENKEPGSAQQNKRRAQEQEDGPQQKHEGDGKRKRKEWLMQSPARQSWEEHRRQ